jgi:choline dehydrogenase-like flavoprotein
MFVDARAVTSDTEITADLCIIGAGAAGITLARALAGTGMRVCLLESGDLNFRWDTQGLYSGRNVGLPYFELDVCQARYFGGNTNAWGGWCRPLDPIDLAPRPWMELSGWPVSRAELEPYYREAYAVCELPAVDFDAASWCQRLDHPRARLLPFDPAKLMPSVYQFSPPTRFGTTYREAIRVAPSLTCLLNANALKLRSTADGRTVSHVDVGTLGGNRFRVSATLFVLSAGGIENARLLLLSNDVQSNGLGNARDLVGRFFMEHPHTKRVLIAAARPLPVAPYGLRFHDRGVSFRLDLPPELQEREELLHYSANIHPIFLGHDTPGWLAFRKLVLSMSLRRLGDPYVRFPPYGRKGLSLRQVGQILRRPDHVAMASLLQLVQPSRFVAGYVLESKSEQEPNPQSRVTLQHDRDAFGLNRAQLDWRMTELDRRTVIRGEEVVDAELRRLRLGRLTPLRPEEQTAWPDNLEGGWHQMGTTRMDADPRRGVVDADGLVHGMSNLFIAGSSVFATGGAAPPTLTIVALALRLADRVKLSLAPRAMQVIRTEPRSTSAVVPAVAARAAASAPIASH